MAYSKIILNGETLMDVTSDTVDADNLLSGETATKNSGAKVTGNIESKSSSDLTVSEATVTAPAGYYSVTASKAVATTTHPNPTATIASATGVVTATHTQGTGYVMSGTTTGTLNLTTQGGKTVTPTEATQTAVASYRWTTGAVSVGAISSTYVGTGVARKSSADLTASGSTVTVPVGYYSAQATKNIASVTHPNPTIGIVSSTGVVTASHSQTSGYVASGTTTSTLNLTTQAGATITPTETAQTAVSSYRWTTGAVTVGAIPSTYIQPTGTCVIRANGTYDVKNYASASVNVSATGGEFYEAYKAVAMNSHLTNTISSFSEFLNSLSRVNEAQFYDRIFSNETFSFNNVTTIGIQAFANLTLNYSPTFSSAVFIFPSVSTISDQAFCSNIQLYEIKAETCSIIRNEAFANCSNLVKVSFPAVTIISSSAFKSCYKLSDISCPVCNSIGVNAFEYCSALTTVNFSMVSRINSNVFDGCNHLEAVSFHSASSILQYAFANCSSLTTLSIPNCTLIGIGAFGSCYNLSTISFPSLVTISSMAFSKCYNLLSVYLLGSSVVNLVNVTAFTSTPISTYTTSTGGVYGSIFVPSSLYNSYIAASRWSVFSSRFVSV